MHIRWLQQLLPVLPNRNPFLVGGGENKVTPKPEGYSPGSGRLPYERFIMLFQALCPDRPYAHLVLHCDRDFDFSSAILCSLRGWSRKTEGADRNYASQSFYRSSCTRKGL